jgi:type I restriction enzyme S subunit
MKKGWQTKTIGDVCDVMNGGTPKTGVPEYWDGNHRWITPAEMGKRLSPYVSDTERKITDLGLSDSSARMLPPNSVILSSRAPIGHLVINTEPMGTNQGCKGLIPRSHIEHKYLYYYLSSIVGLLNSLGTGATFKELSGGKLKEVEIPVPPMAEQQRIVGLLDEVFEGLATANANAEKNLQNAGALFESHLQSVFTQRGPGWVDRQLASLCREITVGHVGPMKTEYKESGIPFLRSQNIRPFEVSMENVMFIDETFHRSLKKSQLRSGDLAIVRTGYPGTAAVIPPELPDSNCSDLVIVRPSKEVNPHFLAAFFNSAFGKQLVLGKIVGAAQKHFNITAAKEVMLHVPPIPEQRTIVAAVDDLREETQRLARLYEQRLAALEALKKSLLHQAFSGAL